MINWWNHQRFQEHKSGWREEEMRDNTTTPGILNGERMFQPYSQQKHFCLESTLVIYTKYCVKFCIKQLPQGRAAWIVAWRKAVLSPSFYRCKIQSRREEVTSTKLAWLTCELNLSSDGVRECFNWKPSLSSQWISWLHTSKFLWLLLHAQIWIPSVSTKLCRLPT